MKRLHVYEGSLQEALTPPQAKLQAKYGYYATVVPASDADRLLEALDSIITAYDLPGDHCELDDAIKAARKLVEEA